ncbi:MAG TPA: hypothetical protein VF670_16335 [Duganella sp.]|jgi:hypothetical protein
MKRLCIAVAIATTLSACGGGGGSSNNAASATPGTSQPVVAAVDLTQTVGDFYSYANTSTFTLDKAGATPQSVDVISTDTVTKTNVDSSWSDTETADNTDAFAYDLNYLADGGLSGVSNDSCGATYTPALYMTQKSMPAGTTWTTNYTRVNDPRCTPGQQTGKFSATAVALETVTVRAGTFNTVKVVSTGTISTSDGESATDETTAWHDAVTHRVVKSTTRSVQVTATGEKGTFVSSNELIGYANAKQQRQRLNIERFAGPWSGSYTGTNTGECRGQVTRAGKLDADCGNGQFTVHGDIDASGNGTFYLTSGGVRSATFSGALTSPLGIGGVWSAASASGTWTLAHQ